MREYKTHSIELPWPYEERNLCYKWLTPEIAAGYLSRPFATSEAKGSVTTYLRCFDTVFQRPHRYFSVALKVVFSLSDRYKIFTSNWLWIEICENVVLSKNRFYYDNNKQKIDKSRILCDLDQLLKIQH